MLIKRNTEKKVVKPHLRKDSKLKAHLNGFFIFFGTAMSKRQATCLIIAFGNDHDCYQSINNSQSMTEAIHIIYYYSLTARGNHIAKLSNPATPGSVGTTNKR